MILTNHPSFFEELGLTSFTTLQSSSSIMFLPIMELSVLMIVPY
ncbi:MAG: hypothetical protein PHW21_06255 [Candidatus Izemoplasmatales bacterium]|nr:hypothetical protein [Candidatus Izemoplasmatales bacterium]